MKTLTMRRTAVAALGCLLCGTLTVASAPAALAAPTQSASTLGAPHQGYRGMAVPDPDDEAVPVVEDVPEGPVPDWVDAGPDVHASSVGESVFENDASGGVTGADVSESSEFEAIDPGAVGKIFSAAVAGTSAEVTAFAGSTKKLALKQYSQSTGYYCGPASGFMMLRYLNAGRSKRTNKALSQAELANSSHMNTASAHGTPWASKRFTTGINRWRGGSYYVQVNKPRPASIKGVFTYSIGLVGMPVAADTVEIRNSVHYNGHPRNKTIGHWIVGFGYEGSGATSFWADPSTSVWGTAHPKFSYNSVNFSARFLQANGVVY